MMAKATHNQTLSRSDWPLDRYLAERSPAPMPAIVRAEDDVLDVAKLAAVFPFPRMIYVVDESGQLLGTIPVGHLAHAIFDLLDNPNRTNENRKTTAESLMTRGPVTITDQETIGQAMRILYFSQLDELPVLDAKGELVGVIRAIEIVREWVEDTLDTKFGQETESSADSGLNRIGSVATDRARPSPESLLAKIKESEQARLRIYIGAAAGVGKTYQMLEEAHELRRRGADVVLGFVEPHGRIETEALIDDLERLPLKRIEYRGSVFEELDVDAVIARHPAIAVIDELAHTNVPGSKHQKRYEDVLDILEAGISVITAVNVQHIESLNDTVARITGVRVRETVPDFFFKRANEVVDVDVSIETLRTRLRQGSIYPIEKIQQALNNFFRKGNLSALRELALRQVAVDQAAKAHDYRQREGLEQAAIPEKVMVAMASRGSAKRILRAGSRIAGRLATDWYAVYVETPGEELGRIKPEDHAALVENIRFAKDLGAKVVKLKGRRVADLLIEFARSHAITHVVFGQSSRSRWDILLHGSVINRFLRDVRDASVHVVPLEKVGANGAADSKT
jgi:two-component system, OmpR family, sensor histidine kinase KdpD